MKRKMKNNPGNKVYLDKNGKPYVWTNGKPNYDPVIVAHVDQMKQMKGVHGSPKDYNVKNKTSIGGSYSTTMASGHKNSKSMKIHKTLSDLSKERHRQTGRWKRDAPKPTKYKNLKGKYSAKDANFWNKRKEDPISAKVREELSKLMYNKGQVGFYDLVTGEEHVERKVSEKEWRRMYDMCLKLPTIEERREAVSQMAYRYRYWD